jgi:Ribosomal RNA-processing protein 7 (RRP7) C-terminal domain
VLLFLSCTPLPNSLHHATIHYRSKKKRVEEKRGSGAPRERVKKNEKELSNFYKFQIREEKQKKLFDLRRRFDEDKEKVAQMKAGRKFKPF